MTDILITPQIIPSWNLVTKIPCHQVTQDLSFKKSFKMKWDISRNSFEQSNLNWVFLITLWKVGIWVTVFLNTAKKFFQNSITKQNLTWTQGRLISGRRQGVGKRVRDSLRAPSGITREWLQDTFKIVWGRSGDIFIVNDGKERLKKQEQWAFWNEKFNKKGRRSYAVYFTLRGTSL